MSLSEYEGQQNSWENADDELRLINGVQVPVDFSDDEITFARELNSLFSSQGEELPPYFVQTLMQSEDQRFQPSEDGLEQRVKAEVFHNLKLTQPISPQPYLTESKISRVSRPLVMLCTACLFVMILTVLVSGPSLAAGMAILLRGAGSGVLQVRKPPVVPTPEAKSQPDAGPQIISLMTAQQALHFPIRWPEQLPANYSLSALSLCDDVSQRWADGPVLEFSYNFAVPGAQPRGNGKLTISEFKPRGNVLQVVQEGAAHAVTVNQNGDADAIYVNGEWVYRNPFTPHMWLYGERSELIYQKDGLIYWIVGDQRDGIDEKTLLSIAQQIQPFTAPHTRYLHGSDFYSIQLIHDLAEPFRGDILEVYSEDNQSGAYVSIVEPGSAKPSPLSGKSKPHLPKKGH